MRTLLTIDAAADEVTLLEDRAHVMRRGRFELASAADTRLIVEGVAPVISDKTLSATIEASGAAVVDARVCRQYVVRGHEPDPSADERALANEAEALRDRLAELEEKRQLIDAELGDLQQVITVGLSEVVADAAWGSEAADRWRAQQEALDARERQLRRERLELSFSLQDLKEDLDRLAVRQEALKNPRSVLAAHLELDLTVTEPGSYEVAIDYVVPGACWRPYHTAELLPGSADGAAPRVAFSTDGCVWQHTGEDWLDAQLLFSTERLSLGTEPPLLATDQLAVKKKSTEVVVEVRDQEITTTGHGAVARPAPELPGIDDGGEVVLLRSTARASVPSDGRPYRTPITSFTTEAQKSHVLMAELSTDVILKTLQANEGSHPILAGPVDLIRDCGFVGRTSVLFIAPGEKFALGWGPDGALRVFREERQLEDEKKILSSWITRVHKVELKLSNIGPEERVVEVKERVPVSELDKVQIEVRAAETTDELSPDENGFLDWTVTLPGFAQREVELAFEVKRHSDVSGI